MQRNFCVINKYLGRTVRVGLQAVSALVSDSSLKSSTAELTCKFCLINWCDIDQHLIYGSQSQNCTIDIRSPIGCKMSQAIFKSMALTLLSTHFEPAFFSFFCSFFFNKLIFCFFLLLRSSLFIKLMQSSYYPSYHIKHSSFINIFSFK